MLPKRTCDGRRMHPCLDCGQWIWPKSTRCKSCVNHLRWDDAKDPRREKLRERNLSVRNGVTPYRDREWLRALYEDRRMTLREIAAEANCGLRTIAAWMERHAIPTRNPKEALVLRPRKQGAESPTWRGGPRKCSDCGASLPGRPSKQHRCQRCADKQKVGSGNPNWRGVGNTGYVVRQWVHDYWRPAVFERDSYTCQHCGDKRGHNLNAHHIVPLSRIMASKRRALKPSLETAEERVTFAYVLLADPDVTSIDNGVTLCEPCHQAHHKRFDRPPGRKGYQ